MGTSLSKKYDAFETCPSSTDPSRAFHWSKHRCAKSWVTVADCQPGFKNLGEVINMGDGNAHCGAFGNADEYAGKCYYDKYPMTEEHLSKCCSGEYPGKICDKSFCWKSKTCKSYMRNYCEKGNNWENKSCKQHFKAFPDEENITLRRKCNTDINMKNSKTCRTFCNDNPGECDSWMGRFCSNNPEDSMCTCINSELSTLPGGASAPAECFDKKCKLTGYRTRAMRNVVKGGCEFVNINCNAIISASKNSSISNAVINQECSVEIAENNAKQRYAEKNNPSVPTKPNNTTKPDNDTDGTNKYTMAAIRKKLQTPIVQKFNLTSIPDPFYSYIENRTIGESILVLLFILFIIVAAIWKMSYATKNPKSGTTVQPDTALPTI